MRTQYLKLLTDCIASSSLYVDWHSNGQMWWKHETKDGKFHGCSKSWRSDGRLIIHDVWENDRLVKTAV